MQHKCPHCAQDCISSWQKLIVSSANSVNCRSCGKPVSIRWRHTLCLLLPMVLLLTLLNWLELSPLVILLIGIPCIVIAGFVQLRYLPLWPDRTWP